MLKNSSFLLFLIISATVLTVAYTIFSYRFVLKRKMSMRNDLLKMFPITIAILASILSVIFLLVSKSNEAGFPIFTSSRDTELHKLSTKIDAVEYKVASLQDKIEAIPLVIEPNTFRQEAVISQIQVTLTKHDDYLKKFEGLVMSEPEKLITLPLMQRDFQNLQNDISTVKERVNDLSSMITETTGQNRWVIGTLAFGMLALVLPVIKSVFTTISKKQEQSE